MTDALETALAYHRAWTGRDFDHAMTYLADDIVCDAPSGRIEGAAAFRAFMEPFSQIAKVVELIAAFGDDRKAVLMYDAETIPVPDAPGAECLTVENGRITHLRIVFDRAPFDAVREAGTEPAPA